MRKRRFIRLALALTLALLTVASALPPAMAAPDLTKTDCSITLNLKGMVGGKSLPSIQGGAGGGSLCCFLSYYPLVALHKRR